MPFRSITEGRPRRLIIGLRQKSLGSSNKVAMTLNPAEAEGHCIYLIVTSLGRCQEWLQCEQFPYDVHPHFVRCMLVLLIVHRGARKSFSR